MGKQRSGSIPCCGLKKKRQKGGSFQVWMRKTMHDNLAGNKVVKKT
jgi:hypothetical protein